MLAGQLDFQEQWSSKHGDNTSYRGMSVVATRGRWLVHQCAVLVPSGSFLGVTSLIPSLSGVVIFPLLLLLLSRNSVRSFRFQLPHEASFPVYFAFNEVFRSADPGSCRTRPTQLDDASIDLVSMPNAL